MGSSLAVTVQSKIKSKDPMWYFFSRRENKYTNGNRQSRTTRSGKWKLTGDSVDVKDQWGLSSGVSGKIGHKRVLVFLDGRYSDKTKSDWVMHEFHDELLPDHQVFFYFDLILWFLFPLLTFASDLV